MKRSLLLLLFCLLPLPAIAGNLLVLVHGYASHAGTWTYSGVNQVLMANGWQPAYSTAAADNVFYTAQLPAHAPLSYQARLLAGQLQALRARYPDKQLTLAGHSAGGMVARLAVLSGNTAGVARLVTIASPNLGTPRASQGLDILKDKPLFCPGPGWYSMKSFFGGDGYEYLEDSEWALYDMLPTEFGYLVAYINRLPHPDISYHSIVRRYGDLLVPAFSQDLNNVPALRGRVKVWFSPASHFLNSYDAQILLAIMAGQ